MSSPRSILLFKARLAAVAIVLLGMPSDVKDVRMSDYLPSSLVRRSVYLMMTFSSREDSAVYMMHFEEQWLFAWRTGDTIALWSNPEGRDTRLDGGIR
jgi:hypothetical protein